jgi:hypothetical protein
MKKIFILLGFKRAKISSKSPKNEFRLQNSCDVDWEFYIDEENMNFSRSKRSKLINPQSSKGELNKSKINC